MTVLARVRGEVLVRSARRYGAVYSGVDSSTREEVQLMLLNRSWQVSLRRSPAARRLQADLGLPTQFLSLEDLRTRVPHLDKADLRPALQAIEDHRGVRWRSTGGTTSSPFRFPILPSEPRVAALDLWYARDCLGIRPWDRAFLLWGHSHLFGRGGARIIATFKRQLADLALGYRRHSAYDLSAEALRTAGVALLKSRARYVIGYAQALERLVEANADRAERFQQLNLKAVIATGESFGAPEAPVRIGETLGAPVAMEYGSVETGPLAYELHPRRFSVFWRHHLLELERPRLDEPAALLVTSLYPRALPLLRYRLGDLIAPFPNIPVAEAFKRVLGRANDVIFTAHGTPIHSEAFSHLLRDQPEVRGFQIHQRGCDTPTICYEGTLLDYATLAALRGKLGRLDPTLSNARFQQVDALHQSPSGKRAMVIREA